MANHALRTIMGRDRGKAGGVHGHRARERDSAMLVAALRSEPLLQMMANRILQACKSAVVKMRGR